jgi:hypothetical protein
VEYLIRQLGSLMAQLEHRERDATARQKNVEVKCTRGYGRSLVLAYRQALKMSGLEENSV